MNDNAVYNQEIKTYSKGEVFEYSKHKNIKMKTNGPTIDDARGYRVKVSLVYPVDKNITPVEHYGKNKAALTKQAKTVYADELYARLPKSLLMFDNEISTGITLSAALDLCDVDMRKAICGRSKKGLEEGGVVLEDLFRSLSDKPIDSLVPNDCMSAIESFISKQNITDLSLKNKLRAQCKELLRGTFKYCKTTGISSNNPMLYAKKDKDHVEIIKKHMKVVSLTDAENLAFYTLYSGHSDDPYCLGYALIHLQGLSAIEACGAKFSDIHSIDSLTSSIPNSSKEFELEEGKPYSLIITRVNSRVNGTFDITSNVIRKDIFRAVPLSSKCFDEIMNRYLYLRDTCGLSNSEIKNLPLVGSVNKAHKYSRNSYCSPDVLRDQIRLRLLESGVTPDALHVPTSSIDGNAVFSDISILDPSVSLLRKNFKFKAEYYGLHKAEIDYSLGLKAKDVDSKHYREFQEKYTQLLIKQKIDRWVIKKEDIHPEPGEISPSMGIQQLDSTDKITFISVPSTTGNLVCTSIMGLTTNVPGAQIELDLSAFKGFSGLLTVTTKKKTGGNNHE